MAGTWYVQILHMNGPTPIGNDRNTRPTWSLNMIAEKRPSDTTEEEIAQVIVAANLGTLNTDLFCGQAARIPDGDGPFTVIIQTPGTKAERTQNESTQVSYEKPGIHIEVHAGAYKVGRTRIRAIFAALIKVVNTTVTVP